MTEEPMKRHFAWDADDPTGSALRIIRTVMAELPTAEQQGVLAYLFARYVGMVAVFEKVVEIKAETMR